MENKVSAIIAMMTVLMMIGVLGSCADEQYYPGMTCNFTNTLNSTDLVYTIIENTTIIPPLNMIIGIDNISITFPGNMTPDNFNIVFIEEVIKEVIVHTHSSGGTRTKYVDKNVTVVQPLFFDRNITKEVEVIKEVVGENIFNVVEEGYHLWQVLLVVCILLILFLILWWKFKN